jgi:exonuclease SbcD
VSILKIIHTSDWHIGKYLHDVNLIEDQRAALNQFMRVLDEEKPDVVIVAGDLYDRSVPTKEGVNLLDDAFNEMVLKRKIQVLCIAGNHDSPDRLEFASKIVKENGLHIVGKLKNEIDKITLLDEYGPVHFYLVPFANISEIKYIYEDHSLKTYDEAYKKILEGILEDLNQDDRNIIVTHGFITSGLNEIDISDSVRPIAIGTMDYVNVDYFKEFDYVALGHLHKPQKVKYDYIRYSGSLFKYSFSEVNQPKGVCIIDLKEKGNINIQPKQMVFERDLIVAEGPFNQLIHPDFYSKVNLASYVLARLTDEDQIYDAISTLRGIYPNILRMEYKNKKNRDQEPLGLESREQKSDIEIFEQFYFEMTSKALSEEKKEIVMSILEEVMKGDEEI